MKQIKWGFVALLVLGLFFNTLSPLVTALDNEETVQNEAATVENTSTEEQSTTDNNVVEEVETTNNNENTMPSNKLGAAFYVAPVTLPAPINQAFPDTKLAAAIAQAVYNNASAVNNTVAQTQLNNIQTLSIAQTPGADVLEQLTAYGGYTNLKSLSVTGSVNVTFPDNFDATQFPNLETMSLTYLNNTVLPDFQLPKLKSLSLNSLNQLTELIDYSGVPLLEVININYANALVNVADFSHIPNLKSLSISSAGNLKAVPDFQYIPNLTSLNLTYTYLDEAVNFSHIPALVSLSHSARGELPDYDNLPNLTSLSIMAGTFTVIPDFSHLPKLSYSYLWTGSKTLEVPDFHYLPNMQTMTIRGLNDGTTTTTTNTVPDFAHMPLMKSFTITGYAITHVPDFAYMPVLKTLAINNTKLNVVPDFSYMPELNDLSLAENLLTAVPNFSAIPDLTKLTISNTLITAFPDFDKLTHLVTLYINNNKITTFPDWNMPELQTLFATSNYINVLPEFTNMKNLRQLNLTSNLLPTIPNLDLPNLTTLALNKNRLSSLPALDLLPKMTSFTVAENALPELPQRVLNFSLSSLTPQAISQTLTVEAGNDFTTDLPIVNQLKPKISGFAVYSARIDGKNVTIGPIDTNMIVPTSTLAPGKHTANISMGTSLSNISVSVSYTVNVVDTTPPVITADAAITYEAGSALPTTSAFIAAVNASAIDNIDGVVSVTADLSSLQMNVPGTYTVVLSASDKSGNIATQNVAVHIADTTPPVITADAAITYEAGSALPSTSAFLTAINASATDIVDGSVAVTTDLSAVQMNVPGTYTVVLRATDAAGNTATQNVAVYIVDTTPPVITADAAITFEAGSALPTPQEFIALVNGVAVDIVDGNVPLSADMGLIEASRPGTYNVELKAVDAAGNIATLNVEVHVVDTTPPVITADDAITYEAGTAMPSDDEFLAAINASANDIVDGVVAISVDFSNVNMNVAGDYIVRLSAVDLAGNSSIFDVTVHIIENTDSSDNNSGDNNSSENNQVSGLPITGENTFVYLSFGVIALLAGLGVLIAKRRK
ncbi:LapB repeat-containing protein [Culicoidibacter larvae]|uniref:LPXTG cell wall anchor domain-containing protein n=1 Tax=Culicoidibacter larvae TaxID=2579976 RepID=A0A5R8Q997_9FIRM|nr:LapB repeat-containing protein [Culicoidibacter larvae]TLG72486.1 LPXTG cell wall anchor domain-containing protein [Culicoidibacter larvae]